MSDVKIVQEHQAPCKVVVVGGKKYRLDHGKATGVPADVAERLIGLDGIRAAAEEKTAAKKEDKPPDKPPDKKVAPKPAMIDRKPSAAKEE